MRRISKKYYLRQIVACWLVFYMLFFFGMPVQVAMADTSPGSNAVPGPGNLTSNVGAGITDSGANWLEVTQTAQEAIMGWNNFDIGSNSAVQFIQPDATAAVLNRVSDAAGTGIMGTLTANGRVFIINPAGIVFGKSAHINVAQLVASSLNISDAAFTSGLADGTFNFTGGANAGDVTNEGSITAERIALIAKNVINRGHIVAGECAIMAAGDTVLISENSPVAVEVTMGADWAPDAYSVYQVRNEDGDGIEVGQGGEMATAQVVLAAGDIWSAALVKASAGGYEPEAVATVDIDAAGDVTVTDKVVAEAFGMGENNATATVTVNSGGDVTVKAEGAWEDIYDLWHVSEALIQAKTQGGMTNTSEILICADGYVTVKAEGGLEDNYDIWHGSTASIEAIAESIDGMAQNNTADVKIGAGEGIEVTAIGGEWPCAASNASASIKAEATGGVEGTAGVVACTEGGVQVIAGIWGEAEILAQALYAPTTDAYVGICAIDDVIVAAGIDQGMGGTAMIKAEAAQYLANGIRLAVNGNGNGNYEPPSANAEVSVVSHEGGVAVIDVGGQPETAKIVAEAYNAYSNTAGVGVAAGGDLSNIPQWVIDGLDYTPDVLVAAMETGSMAYILAYAHNGMENTADTVVCAPGTVAVISEDGGDAGIEARAEMSGLNTATTQVYASEVEVIGEGAYIRASAYPTSISVTDGFCLTKDDKVAWTEGGATLIIDSYSNKKACPDCPPCPCEDDDDFFAPVAPLAQFEIPRVEGCPVLTQAAAMELGITAETIQVAIGNALALNPSIQPCQACATLVNAASILRDEDGSRMAAMVQTFNALAPADAPFTPEMATSIAMAFEGAAEGTQYASAMEYIDAFVQYVAVLDIELGSPVDDSLAFVIEKYGAGITESDNANMAAFVATRLEAIGG